MKAYFIIFIFLITNLSLFGEDNKLVFGTQDFSPFSYKKAGKVAGPGVDIINAVCKDAKLNCSFKFGVWKGIQSSAKKSGSEINGLFFMGKNAEREKWLYFAPPILKTEYCFFGKNSETITYKKGDKLKDSNIGAFGPSNTSKNLAKIKKAGAEFTMKTFKDSKTAFKVLSKSDKLRFVFSNKDVGNAIIKNLKLNNLKYVGSYKTLSYYISFTKSKVNKATYDKFVASYNKLKDTTIKKILKKYNMTPAN